MFHGCCYRWTVWYCLFLVLYFTRISCRSTGSKDDTAGIIVGDIVLGGLFRIRKINGSNKCNKDVEVQVGIQRVEAMLYAIHEINKDQNLLPNVTLGAEIRDTCSLKTKALDESLKFILDSLALRSSSQPSEVSEQCLRNITKDVVGVVGASRSTLSIEVAKLLRLFKVPQVSYASTSAELSNKNKYSYFTRTVPPDSLQARAMLHVVKEFQWSSVFTINSAGSYGENGIQEFKKLAKPDTVCVVASEQVTDESTSEDYKKIIGGFKKLPSTRVVILFMKDNHLKMLLKAAREREYTNIVWIASDEWGTRADVVKNFNEQSQAITLTLPPLRLTKFETYFRNLNGSNPRGENPWFQQYWKQCGNSICNTTFNDKLPYVIDAVYAFAHALHEIYQNKCPEMNGLCKAMKPAVNGTELRDRIFNVTFKGKSSFVKNGDFKGKYAIFYYTKSDQYTKLGEWQNELNLTNVPPRLRNIISTCNETCNPWSKKVAEKGTCCFKCLSCSNKEREYVENETKCIECGSTQRPNANYSGCEDLPLRHISNRWFITITIFACLGALFTLIVTALLLYNINTPLVKASERDLIFLLLLGVFLNYIMGIVFVSHVNTAICAAQRFGCGFSATLCYASLLIKIHRIGRIFTTRNIKSVHFTKPHTQLVVVFLLIAVEVSLASAGLIIKPPEVINILPTNEDIFAKCNFGTLEYMTSLPYNVFLILLCTFYSFRIRKTTSMFNESKYIGLVMFSTCIIWTALLPVHLGTSKSYEPITMGLNTILNATTILVCLFGPKVYILVFRPFRNAERSASVTVNNSVADQQNKVIYVGQSRHVRGKPTDTQTTSANSSKPTSQDQKCEQVNLESIILKNTENENINTITDEKKSESQNENSQSQNDEKIL